MAPIIVDPDKVQAFKDAAALDKWYAKNHAKADEVWIKIAKKDSGIKSVTNAECLDAALSWGWIDSTRKSFDDKVYLQKYAPRTKTSTWSKINIGHVEKLAGDVGVYAGIEIKLRNDQPPPLLRTVSRRTARCARGDHPLVVAPDGRA